MTIGMYVLHYAPDNASLIVRLALDSCGAPYHTQLVDRGQNAQRSAPFLAINPNGLIPALETPQGVIFETAAILLWLADRHQGLFPAPTSDARGDALKWLIYCANTLHPNLRILFYPQKFIEGDQTALLRQTQVNVQACLHQLDTHLHQDSTPRVTQFYVAAALRWCALYGPEDRSWFKLGDTPKLARMVQRLEAEPCTQSAITAEGLGAQPFTAPQPPNPPEGSAL